MNYKLLGIRLRTKREELELTQADLAEISKVSVPFIGHIERGSRKPSVKTLVQLSNALNVSPNYLLQDSLSSSINVMESREHIDKNDFESLEKILRVLKENTKPYTND